MIATASRRALRSAASFQAVPPLLARPCSTGPSETKYGPYTLMTPQQTTKTAELAPLVILFGWSGARDAHLKSYAKAYAAHGYRTLRGTSKQWDFLVNPSRLRSFSMEAFEVAQEVAPKNDFIIHSFSNGGAFLVAEHLRSWSKGQPTTLDASRVAGLVFDSAPAYLHADAGGKAMTASMPAGPLRSAAAASITVLSMLWGALVGERGPEGYWKLMSSFQPLRRQDGSVCPELYVYSENDAITRVCDLRELISCRAGLTGSRILEVVLKESPHVSHLKTAPASYAAICDAFVAQTVCGHSSARQDFLQKIRSAASDDQCTVSPRLERQNVSISLLLHQKKKHSAAETNSAS